MNSLITTCESRECCTKKMSRKTSGHLKRWPTNPCRCCKLINDSKLALFLPKATVQNVQPRRFIVSDFAWADAAHCASVGAPSCAPSIPPIHSALLNWTIQTVVADAHECFLNRACAPWERDKWNQGLFFFFEFMNPFMLSETMAMRNNSVPISENPST